MSLLVGTARVDVDVPLGTQMAGFAGREGASEGVHDPVTVRALLLDGVALVAVDVCALHERTLAVIGEQLAEQARELVITATHTHSGPCVTYERLGWHSDVVHDRLVTAIVSAVRSAATAQHLCEVRYGETPGLGIAKNRRHDASTDDPQAQFLRFDSGDGTVAWLVVYPCHPVVLDATNRLVSGDYPTFVRDQLEAATPGALCLFATGAAGDLNSGHRVDGLDREVEVTGTRTFAEAERIGKVLADAVLAAPLRDARAGAAAVAVEAVELPIERVRAEQAQAEAAQWQAEMAAGVTPQRRALLTSWTRWSAELLAGSYDQGPEHWPGTVTAVALGDVSLVTLPGEPFLATATRIAAAASGPVLVLGYANGCPGYIPPADEYQHGGYEIVDAHRYYGMPGPFAPGGAERLEQAAAAALATVSRNC